MSSYREINRYLMLLFCLVLGCAHPGTYPVSTSSDHKTDLSRKGVYHTVRKGETLWRIATSYDISIERLIEVNKLSDPNKIKAGQKLWVPGVEKVIRLSRWSKSNEKTQPSFIWPVKGKIIHYFTRSDRKIRPGIDVASPLGSNIVAAFPGKVIFSGEGPGTLGKMVIIAHSDGYTTIYAHNSENLVLVNQRVRRGEKIARVGTPLRYPTPYLHFEIRKDGVPYNPLFYLPNKN
jgi:lipoprotein NlpD